jgi:hypothetical protein
MKLPACGRLGDIGRLASLVIVTVAAVGCGHGSSQSAVSGRVLLDGKPVPGGRITFISDHLGLNPVVATIDESGDYGPVSLPVGGVSVCIDNRYLAPPPPRQRFDPTTTIKGLSPELRNKMRGGDAGNQPAPAQSQNYIKIPERYHMVESSDDLKFNVESGNMTHNIDLKSK